MYKEREERNRARGSGFVRRARHATEAGLEITRRGRAVAITLFLSLSRAVSVVVYIYMCVGNEA